MNFKKNNEAPKPMPVDPNATLKVNISADNWKQKIKIAKTAFHDDTSCFHLPAQRTRW